MANEIKKFEDDLIIAKAILNRNVKATLDYMYVTCYPMFKSIYNRYETNCIDCKEFIDEVYTIIMTPGVNTGYCPLSRYRGESSLKTWLRNACLTYCYEKFKKKINLVRYPEKSDSESMDNQDIIDIAGYETMDMSSLNAFDEEVINKFIINRISNERYRKLLWLHLIEKKSHKEIAETMGMTMHNYYNRRKLASDKYKSIRKEMKL